jgi:hypothetical protein
MATTQIAKTIKKRVSRATISGNGLMKIVEGEIKRVRKRNGQTVAFDIEKIVNATYKAMLAERREGYSRG